MYVYTYICIYLYIYIPIYSQDDDYFVRFMLNLPLFSYFFITFFTSYMHTHVRFCHTNVMGRVTKKNLSSCEQHPLLVCFLGFLSPDTTIVPPLLSHCSFIPLVLCAPPRDTFTRRFSTAAI